MYDLEKLEKKFHEYLKRVINENQYRIDEIKITEKLFEKKAVVFMSFGQFSYFLVIDDGKPVIYLHAISRMDLDMVAFIDENGYEEYDIWFSENPDMRKKYNDQSGKLRGIDEETSKTLSEFSRHF